MLRIEARDNLALAAVMTVVLRPDSSFIDVGAHSGDILAVADRLAPVGAHVAFEPIPEFADELQRRLPRADIRAVALSNEVGEASFTVAPHTPMMSGLKERPDIPAGPRRVIRVELSRLDDEITGIHPAMIKIDVEGAELNVLRGAERTIDAHRPVIAFEHGRAAELYGSSSQDLWDLFAEHRYRIRSLHGRSFDRESFGRPLSDPVWNYLAVPD